MAKPVAAKVYSARNPSGGCDDDAESQLQPSRNQDFRSDFPASDFKALHAPEDTTEIDPVFGKYDWRRLVGAAAWRAFLPRSVFPKIRPYAEPANGSVLSLSGQILPVHFRPIAERQAEALPQRNRTAVSASERRPY